MGSALIGALSIARWFECDALNLLERFADTNGS